MITMATRHDRLRGASHAALIAEADRCLAALNFVTRDLGRDLARAKIAASNGKAPLDDATVGNYQQLKSVTDDIGGGKHEPEDSSPMPQSVEGHQRRVRNSVAGG